MPDGNDFVNQIIGTIQKQQESALQLRQLKNQELKDKQQNQLENDRLTEVKKQHADENTFRTAERAANAAHQKATESQQDFESIIHLIQSGATPQTSNRSNNTGDPRKGEEVYSGPVSGTQFAKSLFATPDQISSTDAKKASKVVTAQQTALEPFKVADDARTEATRLKVVAEQTAAHHDDLMEQLRQHSIDNESNNQVKLQLAQSNNETRQLIAQSAAQTRLLLAHQGVQADDNVAQSYVHDAYITGNITNVPVKAQAAVRSSLPSPDWTPITKADNEQINGIPLVEDLIGKVRELADKGSGITGRISATTGIGDAGEASRTVEGLLGNISRIFGGEKGVLNNKDIERAKGLVYSPKNSTAKNKQNADDLQTFLQDKIGPVLNKYAPSQAEQILINRGITPSKYLGKKGSGKVAVDPMIQSYANDHFGGDVAKAQAAIAAQQGGR